MATKTAKKSTAKKPARKLNAQEREAKRLTDAQFAGIISDLDAQKASNLKNYGVWKKRRDADLAKQRQDITLSGNVAGNALVGMQQRTLADFASREAAIIGANERSKAANTASNNLALSNFDSEMAARGLTGSPGGEAMRSDMQNQLGLIGSLNDINNEYRTKSDEGAANLFNSMRGQSTNLTRMEGEWAANQATRDKRAEYDAYRQRNDEYNREKVKTKKDQAAAYINTYMTLKREAQQRADAIAARQLSSAQAGAGMAQEDYQFAANMNYKDRALYQKFLTDKAKLTFNEKKLLLGMGVDPAELGVTSSGRDVNSSPGAKKPGKVWNPTLGAWV